MPNRKKNNATLPRTGETPWRDYFITAPYYTEGAEFEEYLPAYEYGTQARSRFAGKSFAEAEEDVRAEWEELVGSGSSSTTHLDWEAARPAIQDAYDQKIELAEEELHVAKDRVRTGEVKVRKEVRTEMKTIDVPVEHEEVVIERRPARGKGSSKSIGAAEEIRIPVSEEQIHVSKTPVIKEEVTVRKRKVQEKKRVNETVRSEEAVIEEEGTPEVINAGGVRRRKK